ncbi:hypothetical protein F3N42_09200 [Marinihelvus fidelis]|uniref:Cytochrome c domain-containing protein n=1 Tax=Marinihelvus fidelis TaxID=2613842 RepID=A0A5N0TAM9_9GAMM|nr:PQQ-dependent sugar dehydrogenase [Marinihelvus fidelis]KAA9131484.1 hypothetical protein F3N42_09200 [Marinihelvus fidelis]
MRKLLPGLCLLAVTACSPTADPEDAKHAPAASPAKSAPAVEHPVAEHAEHAIQTGPNLSPVDEKRAYNPMHNRGENLRNLYLMNIRNARLDPVVTGLRKPWAFEFIDPNTLLITEIGGRLYRLTLQPRALVEITGLPDIATSQEQTGLLDIEVHPDFANNQRIYFSYSEADPEAGRFFRTMIATARLVDTRLVDVKTLVAADPYGYSPSNFGGAIEFDDTGKLFVSMGDRSEEALAQRGDRLQGKVLRLNDDGSVPADNPFVDDPSMDDRIYALGVRNPQGLHFDAESGLLFETEHGPLGGDEVNIIEAGVNYGWPEIGYGMGYNFQRLGVGTHAPGMRQPTWFYLPSVATSPITVYRGDMFPEWDGDLLVGALRGKSISRLAREGRTILSEFRFLGTLDARMRDIKVADDGAVWVLIEYGGLFRLSREDLPGLGEQPEASGQAIYDAVCAGCHDTGAYGAPRMDDRARWSQVAAKPLETIEANVRDGLGAMPERGMCSFCNDEHLRLVTDFMLETGAAQD